MDDYPSSPPNPLNDPASQPNCNWRTMILRSLYVIVGITIISMLVTALGPALIPLTIALFMSYLTFPLVTLLEGYGLNRTVTVTIMLSLIIVLVVTGLSYGIPLLIKAVQFVINNLPSYLATTITKLNALISAIGISYQINLTPNWQQEFANQINWQDINIPTIGKILNHGATNFLQLILGILYALLLPVFYIYIVKDYENINHTILNLVPRQYRGKLDDIICATDETLSAFLRGQLIIAAILATVYAICLSIIGLPHGVAIGVLTGALSIIPYFGLAAGLIIALITATANSVGIIQIGAIAATFAIVHGLEATVMTPRIVGAKVGLNPLTTLLALIIGGNIAGFWGIIFGVPIGSLTCRAFIAINHHYHNSLWFNRHDNFPPDHYVN